MDDSRRLPSDADVPIGEPGTMLQALDELLKRPALTLGHSKSSNAGRLAWQFAGAGLVSAMLYGLAAGFFQGGESLLLATFKAPFVVALSILLCVPSLYVVSALSGARLTARRFWLAVAGFAGMIGILMLGLVPIVWLFSVSSNSLGFVTLLHAALWMVIVAFASRFLALAMRESGAGTGPALWVLLFILVSFQVATVMRPLLWIGPAGTLFRSEKLFFLEHLGRVLEMPPVNAPAAPRR